MTKLKTALSLALLALTLGLTQPVLGEDGGPAVAAPVVEAVAAPVAAPAPVDGGTVTVVVTTPAPAPAAAAVDGGTPPVTQEPAVSPDPAATVSALVVAAKAGNWSLFAGLLLALLVWLLDKVFNVRKVVKPAGLPWVAAGLGVLGAVSVGLQNGLPVGEVLTSGLTAGATAVGLWELVLKHLNRVLGSSSDGGDKDEPAPPLRPAVA